MEQNLLKLYKAASCISRRTGRRAKITKVAVHKWLVWVKFDKTFPMKWKEREAFVFRLAAEFRLKRHARSLTREVRPSIPLTLKLEMHKRRRFLRAVLEANFRTATAGDHNTFVHFVDDHERVKALAVTAEGNRYSKNTGFRRTDSEHRYFIHRLWGTQVYAQGLAVLVGNLTIAAGVPEVSPEQVEVFPATWVKQGRGFGLTNCVGYIAKGRGKFSHGPTKEKAIQGLENNDNVPQKRLPKKASKFDMARGLFGSFVILPEDWLEWGWGEHEMVCWYNRVGIDPFKTVRLKDVIDGLRLESCVQVISLIRYRIKEGGGNESSKRCNQRKGVFGS